MIIFLIWCCFWIFFVFAGGSYRQALRIASIACDNAITSGSVLGNLAILKSFQ